MGLIRRLIHHLPRGNLLSPRDVERRHRVVVNILWVQSVALLAFGLATDNPLDHLVWEIGGLVILTLVAARAAFGMRFRSLSASLGLVTGSALLVHLSGGYIEAHFHFFVVLGLIVLYEDWLPFLMSIAYVAVHHGIVGTFDPGSVYNHPAAIAEPWLWAGIHAFFILLLSSALISYWKINERARAKTDLALSSTDSALLGLDLHDRVTFANPAAARLLGEGTEDLVGRALPTLLASDPVVNGSTPRAEPGEAYAIPRVGAPVPVEWSLRPVHENGVLVGRVATFRDIRERKEAERQLRASEERFRGLSACSPVGIFLTDTRSLAIYTNPRCQEICGFTAAEALGEGWAQFVHPEDRASALEAWRTYATGSLKRRSSRSAFVLEVRFATPKHGLRWTTLRAAPLVNDAGDVVGHVGTVEDITERRAAENALRRFSEELEGRVEERTRALERTMQEMESFNYSVSHDLRSPLRAIHGFADLLRQTRRDQLDDEGRLLLENVCSGAARMARTIDALLQLSRVTRAEPQRTMVDLSAMAYEIVSEMARQEPERRVETIVRPGMRVEADEDLLRVAMTNMLSNAWKFTRARPHATIEVGVEADDEPLQFFVRDNGDGFEPEAAERLFRPFTRLHDPAQFEGTGVGLATVRRIIERHGGTIQAEGVPGSGATFRFSLSAPARASRVAAIPRIPA